MFKTMEATHHSAGGQRQQVGRRLIKPMGAYGLNLRARSCMVGVDEEYIVHVAGSLLVLQSIEEVGKFAVLPEHDRIHTMLGIHMCESLQVSARQERPHHWTCAPCSG